MKLFYIPVRARAEPIRMILAYGKVPYEDIVIPFHEWPSAKIRLDICHFQKVPSLQLDSGVVVSQSAAVARYCAKLAGLMPVDDIGIAEADMIYELAQELMVVDPIVNVFDCTSDMFREKKDVFLSDFQHNITACERILADKEYFGGANPHYGDFNLFHVCDLALMLDDTCLQNVPHISRWMTRIKDLPPIIQYLESRPQAPLVGKLGSKINPK